MNYLKGGLCPEVFDELDWIVLSDRACFFLLRDGYNQTSPQRDINKLRALESCFSPSQEVSLCLRCCSTIARLFYKLDSCPSRFLFPSSAKFPVRNADSVIAS